MSARRGALVALAYIVLSWALFCHGLSLTRFVLGYGHDPGLIMWFLAWWPYAVAHHLASLVTHLVWQPAGLNLAWTTSVPLLALLAAPVTLTAGPLLAYNLLLLAAPALAALAAYALCRGLGAGAAAGFFGGLIFAFSSFTAAQSFDHLNLVFTALLPLALLVALRRVQGRAGRGVTVVGLGLLLGGEFLISDERLAMSCLFGGLAFLSAWCEAPDLRPRLRLLAVDLAWAALPALLLAGPVLAGMLRGPADMQHPAGWAGLFSVDALNFIVPTQASLFGGAVFGGISGRFPAALDEQTGYLGLPLLALLPVIWRDLAPLAGVRTLFVVLLTAMLASLGAQLHVGGVATGLPLPWAVVAHLPLLGAALPARCMLYAMLAAAVLMAIWVAQAPSARRYAAAGLVSLSLLPAPHGGAPAPGLAFFRPREVQHVLGQNPQLLILPFSIEGDSSFWQAENDFGFTQTGGYLGYPPRGAQAVPVVKALFANKTPPGFAAAFAAYAQAAGTQYVVATPGTTAPMLQALASLHWSAQRVDDVTIFTIPRMPPP